MSKTVAILPTGRTEWHGLGAALTRIFPDHTFYSLPTTQEVASERVGFPYAGFTSAELTDESETKPPECALELVERAAQEAVGDRKRKAADLVLIVEDLELLNAHQPRRVVSVMRKAAEQHLEGLASTQVKQKTQAALRSKASFHLIAPMIEAWFFGDTQSLARAGVPEAAAVCFGAQTDPEAFETADPSYLKACAADCPALAALPSAKQKQRRPKWLGTLHRAQHPKGYLQWLCRDPADRACTTYSESKHGGEALAKIRWEVLLARPPEHFAFLRALIEDLEDGLDCRRAIENVEGAASLLTARSSAPRNAVMRNI